MEILKTIRAQLINNPDTSIAPSAIEGLVDSWNSWVIDTEISKLNVSVDERKLIKDTENTELLLSKIKSDSPVGYLATIKYVAVTNSYYRDLLMKVYFNHE